MRLNRKGFSLLEIIVAVAIMAVLASVLAPALMTSRKDSNVKMDQSAVDNFETTLTMAFQNNSIYKDARDLADNTYDGIINVVCGVDENKVFKIEKLEITHMTDGLIDDTANTEAGQELAALRVEIENFVNGNIESITLQSEEYITTMHYYDVHFPDVDFKVEIGQYTGGEKDVADANGSVAAPGLYRGAYKEDGKWILPQSAGGGTQLHLHTGYGGMESNQKGDIWKITLTGENLQDLFFGLSYRNESNGWPSGGSDLLKVVKNGNSYEIYIQSTVDSPSVAVTIGNGGSDTAVIDNVQFVKVDEAP